SRSRAPPSSRSALTVGSPRTSGATCWASRPPRRGPRTPSSSRRSCATTRPSGSARSSSSSAGSRSRRSRRTSSRRRTSAPDRRGGGGMTSRLRARLARKPPGYRFTIGRILVIYSGLMVTLLLAALDQTIVATALPKIVGELGGLGSYSWVFTSYLLASTVTVPLYGKLGDVYGRRPLFFVAIGLFLAGSALCGVAWGMPELIVFRGIQGLGAGGLFPLALATVGNIVPPRDRGRYQGLIGATFAGASIAGPALGGFIVDNMSWRWVFYVNLPVGGLALLVIYRTFPRRSPREGHSIDWSGAALLALAT